MAELTPERELHARSAAWVYAGTEVTYDADGQPTDVPDGWPEDTDRDAFVRKNFAWMLDTPATRTAAPCGLVEDFRKRLV